MLAQRMAVLRPLARQSRFLPAVSTITPARTYRVGFDREPMTAPLDPASYPNNDISDDPGLNGGYVNPPRERRQFRDPYGKWDDMQERRNFGEPVHEDNDILSRLSPEEYTWTTPKKGVVMVTTFIGAVLGLCGVVYMVYPDKPAVPRTFPHNGLEVALGGQNALLANPEK